MAFTRAQTAEPLNRRDAFIRELLNDVDVYPYTKDTALLAGRLDGEQQSRGVTIPFVDLLIGATALEVGYSLLTVNARHFRFFPQILAVFRVVHSHLTAALCI